MKKTILFVAALLVASGSFAQSVDRKESKKKQSKVSIHEVIDTTNVHLFINGKEANMAEVYSKLNPAMISNIEVKRDEATLSRLGITDGKGAILVTLKKQKGKAPKKNKTNTANDGIVYASFPGGVEAMKKFLSENLKYPDEAFKDGIEGRVLVGFGIDEDGNLTDIAVKRRVNPYFDAEAVRVVRAMPKWIPAKKDGQKVKSHFTVPIVFKKPK